MLCDFPSHRLLVRLIVPGMSSLCGAGLISDQKVVGYPHNSHATVTQLCTSCLAGCCCSKQGPTLSKTIDTFFSSRSFYSPFLHCDNLSASREEVDCWFKINFSMSCSPIVWCLQQESSHVVWWVIQDNDNTLYCFGCFWNLL